MAISVLSVTACLLAWAATAWAQSEPAPPRPAFSAGGELLGIVGPRDTDAFFNYTEYERNGLRLARLRVLGQWRIAESFSILGELRTENGIALDVAGLYARWRPFRAHEFDVQAGRIPPVIGAFARRAYGRDNAVIGWPLAYQYLTSLRPDAVPILTDDLLRMRARGWLSSFPLGSPLEAAGVPLVSASTWDTGVQAGWRRGWMEVAAAVTSGSPAVPVVRETNEGKQLSGRFAAYLPAGIVVGVSGGRGQWLDDAVMASVPAPRRDASDQTVVAADFELGAGRWLVRAEWLRSMFATPLPAMAASTTLGAWSAFAEIRYRVHPRWQLGIRLDRLSFDRVTSGGAGAIATTWDAPVDRLEAVAGFRASRRLELKAGWQGDWRDGGRVRSRGFPVGQVLFWF